jgi:hypothetical protein
MQNQDIVSVKSIVSASGKWRISEEGDYFFEEINSKTFCLEDQCFGRQELKDLFDLRAQWMNTLVSTEQELATVITE